MIHPENRVAHARWKRLIGQRVYHTSKGPTVGRSKGRGRGQSQAGNWKGRNMAEKVRYNKIIDLLERGKPVFSTSTVPNGNLDDLTYIARNEPLRINAD